MRVCGRTTRSMSNFMSRNRTVLLLSLGLQLLLGLFLGHFFEMRFYMATGYLAGTGQNPYVAQDLSAVFHNPFFKGMTSFGYPPPWALALGLIYRCTYAVLPHFLLYNLACKLPIIGANIGLACLVAGLIDKMGASQKTSRRAWAFMLLNPFLLFASAAWGQIDSIVALLSLLALVRLDSGKWRTSALLLALAVSVKPVALPLVPAALVFLWGRSRRRTLCYSALFIAATILFSVAPFMAFGWDPGIILRNWNAHFIVGGCMSFMSFYEIAHPSFILAGPWRFLGFLWMPALGVAVYAARSGITDFEDLLKTGLAFLWVFLLTRAWMSEPNAVLIIPFLLILTSVGRLDGFTLFAAWTLPLAFSVFNSAASSLLFPSLPDAMETLFVWGERFRTARLLIKTLIVIPWLVIGWRAVFICLKKRPVAVALKGE
jgi:hypothetical protein